MNKTDTKVQNPRTKNSSKEPDWYLLRYIVKRYCVKNCISEKINPNCNTSVKSCSGIGPSKRKTAASNAENKPTNPSRKNLRLKITPISEC